MSNLVNYAKSELALIGMTSDSKDEGNRMMYDHIIHMVEEFSNEGHSGFSASYAVKTLNKLLSFEPLTPLTGEDSEWEEVSFGLFQNKRCSHVFKDESGVYDSTGKVFVDPDGGSYTSRDSRVNITFPYTPRVEYVNVKK